MSAFKTSLRYLLDTGQCGRVSGLVMPNRPQVICCAALLVQSLEGDFHCFTAARCAHMRGTNDNFHPNPPKNCPLLTGEEGQDTMQHPTRTFDMRKTLSSLSLAVLLASGQAFADQATLDSLQAAGVALTAAQAQTIAAAEGDALVAAIASLVAANPEAAAAIVAAAVSANPAQAAAITAAAVSAAPAQVSAITAAAIGAAPAQAAAISAAANNAASTTGAPAATSSGGSVATSSVPSGSGGGGGSSASPN